MIIIYNRRNVIYTCGLLDKLYNLKNQDIKELDNGNSYAGTQTIIENTYIVVGLCDSNYHYHILTIEEILMLEMLLSWNALLENAEDLEEDATEITLTDIDWIRNRKIRNKEYIQQAHNSYIETVETLNKLFFIFQNEEELVKTTPSLDKIINISCMYENDDIIGFRYSLGRLGKILKTLNQRISLNVNIFEFSSVEFMKYQILRYIVSSIYMCRVKHTTFSRTHKSILQAITYRSGDVVTSYYDYIMNSNYPTKYLKRYTLRLDEVMKYLKGCHLIKDYTIIPDISKRGLLTSSGKIVMTVFNKRRKHCINQVKDS